jgi:hypothetical protein
VRYTLPLILVAFLASPAALLSQQALPADSAITGAPKSASRAQVLSIAHTTVATTAGLLLLDKGMESDLFGIPGFLLFYYGVVGGPSAGSFYARDLDRAQTGLAIRTAGAALVITSKWRHLLSGGLGIDPDPEPYGWDALNVTGAVIIAAGTAYSIAAAPRSARDYNRRAGGEPGISVSVAPAVAPEGGGVRARLDLRF